MKKANSEHLTERCALLVILTFGETLIGLGEIVSMEYDLLLAFFMFALVVTLFLIILNEYELALDTQCKTSGAMRKRWIAERLAFVAIIVLAPVFLDVHVYLSVFIAVAALFGVFLFDRMLYFKLVPIEASKQAPTSNPKE